MRKQKKLFLWTSQTVISPILRGMVAEESAASALSQLRRRAVISIFFPAWVVSRDTQVPRFAYNAGGIP